LCRELLRCVAGERWYEPFFCRAVKRTGSLDAALDLFRYVMEECSGGRAEGQAVRHDNGLPVARYAGWVEPPTPPAAAPVTRQMPPPRGFAEPPQPATPPAPTPRPTAPPVSAPAPAAPAFDLSAEIRRLRGLNVPHHVAVAVAHRNRDRHVQGLPPVTPRIATAAVPAQAGPPERPARIPPHVWDHLTAEEQEYFAHPRNHEKGRAAMEHAARMASHPEHLAAVQAGMAQKDWYDLSERVVGQFGEHAPLVAHLLAANSTKNPPARNLLEALAIYRAWLKAKPKDRQVVPWERVLADGRVVKTVTMPFLQKLAHEPGMGGILFGARHTPTVRVLAQASAPEKGLTGQKTRNFAGNLNPADPNSRNRVTNDVWQAIFHSAGGDAAAVQKLFNDLGVYAASSAGVRRAASAYGMDPRQAQAAIWSGMMTMAGMAKAGLTPQEVVRYITHEHVAEAVDSFFNLLGRDERVRAELERIDRARGGQTLEGVVRLAESVRGERERAPGPRGPVFAASDARTRRIALALAERAARYATSYRGSVVPFDDALAQAMAARQRERHARTLPAARYASAAGTRPLPLARYLAPAWPALPLTRSVEPGLRLR
jgi:hypothetical protein